MVYLSRRDNMLVENKRHAPAARPVRDGMWIKTDKKPVNHIPSATGRWEREDVIDFYQHIVPPGQTARPFT